MQAELAPELLTLLETAGFLKIHRVTLYRWLKAGRIQGSKVGGEWRFRKEDLAALFATGQVTKQQEASNATQEGIIKEGH